MYDKYYHIHLGISYQFLNIYVLSEQSDAEKTIDIIFPPSDVFSSFKLKGIEHISKLSAKTTITLPPTNS